VTALGYAHGVSDTPLLDETIGANLARTVAGQRDRDALVLRRRDVRWSYAELDERVDRVARGLMGLGLQRGHNILNDGFFVGDRPAGWIHTGDLATMDRDGYVKIVGRSKDMIIRGGDPREIEELLYTHPDADPRYVLCVDEFR
jgi:acyl-CoA synthetase (AMP-forming)/AMP-acid ligase II